MSKTTRQAALFELTPIEKKVLEAIKLCERKGIRASREVIQSYTNYSRQDIELATQGLEQKHLLTVRA